MSTKASLISKVPIIPQYSLSTKPSTQKRLVDFEKGLILVSAITPESLKQSIVNVLLTQIDPSVIDAKTAQDFGLVNQQTNRPFFWGQVVDHTGKPIEALRAAAEFADVLVRRRSFKDERFTVTIAMVKRTKILPVVNMLNTLRMQAASMACQFQ